MTTATFSPAWENGSWHFKHNTNTKIKQDLIKTLLWHSPLQNSNIVHLWCYLMRDPVSIPVWGFYLSPWSNISTIKWYIPIQGWWSTSISRAVKSTFLKIIGCTMYNTGSWVLNSVMTYPTCILYFDIAKYLILV